MIKTVRTIISMLLFATVIFGSETDILIISDIAKWNHPTKKVFIDNGFNVDKVELKNNKTFPIFYLNDINSEKIYNEKFLKEVAKANGYWSFKIVEGSKFAEVIVDGQKRIYSIESDKSSFIYLRDGNLELKAEKTESVKKKVEVKEDPVENNEIYDNIVKFAKTIPERDVKDMKLKQDKRYDNYIIKTNNFYEYIFDSRDTELTDAIKKDYNRNKKLADKIIKFAVEDIGRVNYIEVESKVISENEKTVILKDYVSVIITGLMKPIDYTGFSFITEIDKNSNTIVSVNIEKGTEPAKGTYLTWEYVEMVKEYGRNCQILNGETDFDYEKTLSELIIQLEKTKEKIVDITIWGAITKSENGKYNYYSTEIGDDRSKINFKKIKNGYDKILYYKILDKKEPSQSGYTMVFYKKWEGLEFYDTVSDEKGIIIKEGYLTDGITADMNLNIIPFTDGKFGLYDSFGEKIFKQNYDEIKYIYFADSNIYRVKDGGKYSYKVIVDSDENYIIYDIDISGSKNSEILDKKIFQNSESGMTLLK